MSLQEVTNSGTQCRTTFTKRCLPVRVLFIGDSQLWLRVALVFGASSFGSLHQLTFSSSSSSSSLKRITKSKEAGIKTLVALDDQGGE
jgi:hypothetical protein